MENWAPPDIASICLEQNSALTQCSQTGLLYLTILAQLFGNSIDNISYPPKNPYSLTKPGISSETSDFDFEDPFSIFEDVPPRTTQIPLGPVPAKNNDNIESLVPHTKPALAVNHKMKIHSYGPDGSHGFYETSYYMKPDNHEFDFDFEKEFKSPFSSFESKQPLSNFDFNFLNQNFFDAATADSKKITVAAEPEINKKSKSKRQAVEEYDFIIVGAGSAGCVIANRLSEVKKWKILLIEAGPEEPEVTSVPALAPVLARSSIDWMYRTQPEELTCRAQRGQTCAWLSGKVMGGSSAINYLVYMRGNKKDYDEWAALGNEGWSYEKVLPYFKKSENNRDIEIIDEFYHGTDGPLTVERFSYIDKSVDILVNAFQETGLPLIDFNGHQQIGTMRTQTTSEDGIRMSTNVAFVRPIRKTRNNLVISTSSQVTKILIEPRKKIAYGIEYVKNGDIYKVHARKEVILCAGGLNSPKLLMLSGIGPKSELQHLKIKVYKDLKVGYNLQDHVTTDAMLMSVTNDTSTLISAKQILNKVTQYHASKHREGPLSATGPVHASAFIRTEFADKDESVPDIQFHFDGRNLKEFYSDPTNYLATNVFPFSFYDSINVRPILLKPKSRGYLTLNKTNPIFGQPLIYPRFFTVREDLDTLVAALRFVTTLEDTNSFQDHGIKFVKTPVEGCSRYKWGTYNYFACLFTSYTTTIFHPSGTCKMGPHWDKDAVVDPKLRVYGIKHLRVADASIMPKIVRGNTNAPVIMIGEKASDIIKEDWDVA